jgi:hypothetical protein
VEALALAAPAFWERAKDNPRETKRQKNIIRFLVAAERSNLEGVEAPQDSMWEPNLVGFAAFGEITRFPAFPHWKWEPTAEEAERYHRLCRSARLNPQTLEPEEPGAT